jgi:hypothetical protein
VDVVDVVCVCDGEARVSKARKKKIARRVRAQNFFEKKNLRNACKARVCNL